MSEIASALADIERVVETGDLFTARQRAIALAEAEPESPEVQNLLGFIAYREGRLLDAQRAFEQAVAGGDADAVENLRAVRAELAANPVVPDLSCTVGDLQRGKLGPELDAVLLGRLLGAWMSDELEARLNEIPSAAAQAERRFLLRFASRLWDGRGDVFENGPLLGGTTRALALGMLSSPRRGPTAQLHTYDWFSSRVALDLPPEVWPHLVAKGLISAADAATVESGSFLPIFEALHSGHDYSPLVRAHVGYLPGAPDDDPFGDPRFEPVDRVFSLVFVDGCKSWYGTRYWLERMADRMPAGSHVIMQDYGWFTCFWLPAIVGLLADHFRLVAHIDDTYAFELVRPLTAEQVRGAFPEQPADLGRDGFDELFVRLGAEAGARTDLRGAMVLALQHAGAIAYLGDKEEAAARIRAQLDRPEYAGFRERFLRPALQSPTYTPDGPVTLEP